MGGSQVSRLCGLDAIKSEIAEIEGVDEGIDHASGSRPTTTPLARATTSPLGVHFWPTPGMAGAFCSKHNSDL